MHTTTDVRPPCAVHGDTCNHPATVAPCDGLGFVCLQVAYECPCELCNDR